MTRSIFRDFLMNIFPLNAVTRRLAGLLYGKKIDFIFLVHPRHKKDIYDTVPLLKFIAKFIPEKIVLKILALCPAYVVSKAEWDEGRLRGLVISTSIMPKDLLTKRENTVAELGKIVRFIRKITRSKVYVGLAAWWPIVTNSGLAFRRVLSENDRIVITNGHTATLVSMYLMLNSICEIAGTELRFLKILIIGVGKMGAAVAEKLNGKVESLGIIDRNETRMKSLEYHLLKKNTGLKIKKYIATESLFADEIYSILQDYHIVVCTTSNINYIIKDSSALRNCLIIDDSRPEAFPRVIDSQRKVAVLEGGLLKFKGISLDADFGYGMRDNVFGCMGEALLLALDGANALKPVVGEINDDSFDKMLAYCKENNVREGDFKSGHNEVAPELLRNIIKNKERSATGETEE